MAILLQIKIEIEVYKVCWNIEFHGVLKQKKVISINYYKISACEKYFWFQMFLEKKHVL